MKFNLTIFCLLVNGLVFANCLTTLHINSQDLGKHKVRQSEIEDIIKTVSEKGYEVVQVYHVKENSDTYIKVEDTDYAISLFAAYPGYFGGPLFASSHVHVTDGAFSQSYSRDSYWSDEMRNWLRPRFQFKILAKNIPDCSEL